MSFSRKDASNSRILVRANKKGFLVLILLFVGCSSQTVRQAEVVAREAERAVAEQEIARIAIEEERVREAEARERIALEERRREAEAAERERIALERRRQEVEAEEREIAEANRRRREETEQLEQERAMALAERQEKLELIARLEAQITVIQSDLAQNDATVAVLQEAILAAEELLDTLMIEQTKYESTDNLGNTLEPLAKDLIGDLEARMNDLVQQARPQ